MTLSIFLFPIILENQPQSYIKTCFLLQQPFSVQIGVYDSDSSMNKDNHAANTHIESFNALLEKDPAQNFTVAKNYSYNLLGAYAALNVSFKYVVASIKQT